MKPFAHQLMLLVLSSMAVYALLLCATLLLVPSQRQISGLDTSRAAGSLFATEPKYVFLNRSVLNSTHNKVLLLGASNVVVGFKPAQLRQALPDIEIHNLSVGGSNVTQLRQIVQLVQEVQSTEARRHNLFVIGLWYGLFAEDGRRWYTPDRHGGDTDIDIERYRYGFFRRTSTGAVALLPPDWLDTGVWFIHPYLAVDKLVRDASKAARRVLKGEPPVLTDAQRNLQRVSEQDKARFLAFWSDYMGNDGRLSDEQFGVLQALVGDITASGGRVILVDLPLPPWHVQRSPYYADYQTHLRQIVDAARTQPGVSVMRLRQNSTDSDFSDEVHPKPMVTQSWAHDLAENLIKQDSGTRVLGKNTVSAQLQRSAFAAE